MISKVPTYDAKDVENHVQTVHRDESELKHKLDSPERRPNFPHREHEVIHVIAGGFVDATLGTIKYHCTLMARRKQPS